VTAVGQRLLEEPGVGEPVAQPILQAVEAHASRRMRCEAGSGAAGRAPARRIYSLTLVLAGRLDPAKSMSTLIL
jgi:hypothetical protein